MKKAFLATLFTILTLGVTAQIKTPKPSPASSLTQDVGLTKVKVNYSRPSMKGRAIFGDLVPYDALWRTGANKNTTIEFSTSVTIGDGELKAGKYAIFAKPGAKTWEIFFYRNTENWGTPKKWDDSKVATKVKVDAYKMPVKIETFTITVDDLTNDSANLGLMWEDIYIGIPFKTPANAVILKDIESTLNGPNANDYYTAAVYLSNTEQNLEKAKEYMAKAMAKIEKPRFWQLRQQSLILAKTGDKKGAIVAAEKSLADAKASGNKDYIKLNTDSIKEWSK